MPGTNICWQAQGNGQGGGKVGAGAQAGGSVGPGGATGNASAGGYGQGNASGQASSTATVPPPPPPPPPPLPPPPPPPVTLPPPSTPSPPTYHQPTYGPRGGGGGAIFVDLCGVMRIGVHSGVRGGGCLEMGGRGEHWGFAVDVLAMGGGTVPSFDLAFVPELVYRIGPRKEPNQGLMLHLGLELRFGWPTDAGPITDDQMFHIGGVAGVGYEHRLGQHVAWRIADVRFYAAKRTDGVPVADDLEGRRHDLGLLVSTGFSFQ